MTDRSPVRDEGRANEARSPTRSGTSTGKGKRTNTSNNVRDNGEAPKVGRAGRPLPPRPVGPRRERYLVAHLGDPKADNLFDVLQADPLCVVHRVIPALALPARTPAPNTAPVVTVFPPVAVVQMEADRAARLASGPLVHVEPDLSLQYTGPSSAGGLTFADPGVIPCGDVTSVVLAVAGSDGKALEGAEVYLMSEAFPVRGITDADGHVVLNTLAGSLPVLRGVYVRPRHDYWAVWLGQPNLTLSRPNLVTCPSFAETLPGFPERHLDGWARRAMRFDALPPTFRGHGVRIAIIDSGTESGHPDLVDRVTAGHDMHDENDASWRVDTVGHGSHCAGIIGGTDNGFGIVGIVPEAEIHSCKIFPGGRFSDLIEAIDYCITHQIDVVNLSLGATQPSELLTRKIEQARQAGVACVVAAGNSGGAVSFPASMPGVLAVAAIGKTGEYPAESYHATQVHGVPTPDGYFSASFTCFGPEIDVCAPGVAIVSCVPPANYAGRDGTSFAAPYVTGLAALLLAHHTDFRQQYARRDTERVDRLFDLIRGSCRPMQFGDPGRSGAGLPDAIVALGLVSPETTTPPAADGSLAHLRTAMAQAGLIRVPATQAEPPPLWTWPADVPMDLWAGPGNSAGNSVGGSAGPRGRAPVETGARLATTTDPLDPLRAAMQAAGLLPLVAGD